MGLIGARHRPDLAIQILLANLALPLAGEIAGDADRQMPGGRLMAGLRRVGCRLENMTPSRFMSSGFLRAVC